MLSLESNTNHAVSFNNLFIFFFFSHSESLYHRENELILRKDLPYPVIGVTNAAIF